MPPLLPISVLAVGLAAGCLPGCTAPGPSARVDAQARSKRIENIEWRATSVAGVPVVPGLGDSKGPWLRFDAGEKRMVGSTGVNSFSSAYHLWDRGLNLGPVVMTKRAGPPELMQQESAFTAALDRATDWRLAGDALELVDTNGAVVLKLSR